MEPTPRFRYDPTCSETGCGLSAVYKAAAAWSDGTTRELKTYGLACPAHAEAQLDRARRRRGLLRLEDGENLGEVRLYRLDPNRRDVDLECVHEGFDAAGTSRPPRRRTDASGDRQG